MSAVERVAVVSRRVHPAHGPGGLERHVHDQVMHLGAAGVRVDLYTETPTEAGRRRDAEEAFGGNVVLHWVEGGRLPVGDRRGTVVLDRITNYPRWSRRVARRIDPDCQVVHVHGLAGLGAAEARERGDLTAPLVLTTHGMEEFTAPPLKRLAYKPFRAGMRRIGAAADRIVVTDDALLPVVRASLRVDDDRLVVIPNAIDPQACTAAADRAGADALLAEAGLGGPPLFVSVGRLAPNKGFDILAAALAAAADRLPDRWGWVLVGDGHEHERIASVVAEGGIAAHTLMAGRLDDGLKHGLLSRADWFVHPTLYEGSSLVTLEAMAHFLPVIASRAGGLPDKVIDGESGWLLPPGEPQALSDALVRAAGADPGSMGRAGHRLLMRRFAWSAALERYLRLYRELLGGE
jgi:glycosyltransferase involved in cell wall biosynthesis